MDALPIAINGPVAGVEIRNSVETVESGGAGHAAGAIAMTLVPQHFPVSIFETEKVLKTVIRQL